MINYAINAEEKTVSFEIKEDGKESRTFTKQIKTDDTEGKEYFEILDPYDNTNRIFWKFRFDNKIGDAIRAIRDGIGDTVSIGDTSSKIYVRCYLDREYGEKLRAQTLEGFKNTKFGTCICANGYLSQYFLTTDFKFAPYYDAHGNIYHFNSLEEAHNWLLGIKAEADKAIKNSAANGYDDIDEVFNKYANIIVFDDEEGKNPENPTASLRTGITIGQYVIEENEDKGMKIEWDADKSIYTIDIGDGHQYTSELHTDTFNSNIHPGTQMSMEYIIIPNFAMPSFLDKHIYAYRAIDCANQIKDGRGDGVDIDDLGFMKIRYYLNRDFGENYRRATIKGLQFKIPEDPTDRYFIYIKPSSQGTDDMYYGTDNKFHLFKDYKEVPPIRYKSEEVALQVIQDYFENYKILCENYHDGVLTFDQWEEHQKDWHRACRNLDPDTITCDAKVGQWVVDALEAAKK